MVQGGNGESSVIAVLKEKGGSGKSTVCQGLAVAKALEGRRVAPIDTDRNCSSSTWYEAKPNPFSTGLAAVTAKHAHNPAPALAASVSLPAPPAQPAAAKGRGAKSRSGGRAGRVMVGGFFGPTTHKQLKMLAVEQDKTSQELLEEALDLLFSRYGKPQIAQQLTD